MGGEPREQVGGRRQGWIHDPRVGSKCVPSCPLGCLCAPSCLVRRGRSFSPHTCCSLLWFLRRSEFTDTILSVHPSDVLDMPVDPNEPTYCLCHQVSYGEMIGCDNPDVSVGAVHGPRAGPCTQGRGCGGCGGGGAHGVLTAALPSALQCPIEWFHFACVDLTTKPKGKWSVWALLDLSLPVGRRECCPHQAQAVATGSPWVLLPGAELVGGHLRPSPGSGLSGCLHGAPLFLLSF